MSRGSIPAVLMMAMALPGTVRALGLGELRVTSALNEPLSAQIDIVGADPVELAALTARIADRDVFRQFGADRPTFLNSATFKVRTDAHGNAVLLIQSTEAFTEPLISLLVNLNWGSGHLIREYSILLDPAPTGRAVTARSSDASLLTIAADPFAPVRAPQASPRASVPRPAVTVTRSDLSSRHRVIAGDTLHAIALHAAGFNKRDVKRTMLAIYRANPAAFGGNINQLKRGVTLTIPASAQIAAIPRSDAAIEVGQQMRAWHAADYRSMHALARVSAEASKRPASPAPRAPDEVHSVAQSIREPDPAVTPAAETPALTGRVQSLEQSLHDVRAQIEVRNAAIESLTRQVQAQAAQSAKGSIAPTLAAVAPASGAGVKRAAPIALGLALAFTCFALLRRRWPLAATSTSERAVNTTPVATATDPAAEINTASVPVSEPVSAPAVSPAMEVIESLAVEPAPIEAAPVEPRATAEFEDTQEMDASLEDSLVRDAKTLDPDLTTMILDTRKSASPTVANQATKLQPTRLDYDLTTLDPEATAQHVFMPSNLSDRPEFVERRTNVAQVLKSAFERDPTRRDLLMKLLEIYHRDAATNQRAFLDVVRQVARQQDFLSAAEWSQVVKMGREIAAGDSLFAGDAGDDTLAKTA